MKLNVLALDPTQLKSSRWQQTTDSGLLTFKLFNNQPLSCWTWTAVSLISHCPISIWPSTCPRFSLWWGPPRVFFPYIYLQRFLLSLHFSFTKNQTHLLLAHLSLSFNLCCSSFQDIQWPLHHSSPWLLFSWWQFLQLPVLLQLKIWHQHHLQIKEQLILWGCLGLWFALLSSSPCLLSSSTEDLTLFLPDLRWFFSNLLFIHMRFRYYYYICATWREFSWWIELRVIVIWFIGLVSEK